MSKTIKSLQIGDLVYVPTVDEILSYPVIRLELEDNEKMRIRGAVSTDNHCLPNWSQTTWRSESGRTVCVNLDKALTIQHKMRVEALQVRVKDLNKKVDELTNKMLEWFAPNPAEEDEGKDEIPDDTNTL